MYKINYYLNHIVACALIFSTTPSLYARDRVTLSSGLDYSVGNYGATSDTEIWYIPFTAKLEKPSWVYKLTIPFIQITGPGYVSGLDAAPSRTGSTTRSTESGMGDVIASVSYVLLPYQVNRLAIDITARIKLPTADEDRGLGTGETDYYLQADGLFSANKLTIFGSIGYKVYGDPADYDYRNVIYLSLGETYPYTDKLSGGFIYDFRQATTSTGTELSEVLAFTSAKLDNKTKLLVYLVKGLSAGSPDWGIGVNLAYIL